MRIDYYFKYSRRRLSKSFLCIFVLSLTLSCGDFFTGKGKFENSIGVKIRETCVKKEKCSIRIYESTWFDWDKMIVFSGGFTYIDLNHVLEKDYFKESKFGNSNTLVFFKDKEIVYAEENFREAEGYRNGDLLFTDIDDSSQGYQVYKRDSDFRVERNALQSGEYYTLTCINCDK
jgi:hypothetical protein